MSDNIVVAVLNLVELASVLAGLRLLQAQSGALPDGIEMIASDCGEFTPLSEDGIDRLCYRLNGGED